MNKEQKDLVDRLSAEHGPVACYQPKPTDPFVVVRGCTEQERLDLDEGESRPDSFDTSHKNLTRRVIVHPVNEQGKADWPQLKPLFERLHTLFGTIARKSWHLAGGNAKPAALDELSEAQREIVLELRKKHEDAAAFLLEDPDTLVVVRKCSDGERNRFTQRSRKGNPIAANELAKAVIVYPDPDESEAQIDDMLDRRGSFCIAVGKASMVLAGSDIEELGKD